MSIRHMCIQGDSVKDMTWAMTGRSHVRDSEKAERERGIGGKRSEWRG